MRRSAQTQPGGVRMTSAIVAVVGIADPLSERGEAQFGGLQPSAALPGGSITAFPTASAAVEALDELRARRPFTRAALDVGEVRLDPDSRPVLGGLESAARALAWALAAQPGELLLSELALRLVSAQTAVRCAPHEATPGVHRLLAPSRPIQPLALPRLLSITHVHPFVNRYAPWLELERAWAAATSGERRVVLLDGEAGSGKTRLVTEFARRALTVGGIVLYGGSTEAVELPFQPFNEALRPAFEKVARLPAEGAFDERALTDLAALFPWATAPGSPDDRPGSQLPRGPDTDRHWAFEAVVDLFVMLTELAPALLILDDLHWAQRPTLRLLEHLLRSGRVGRLCIVATSRAAPGERTEAFVDSLATWGRLPGVERVDLERFDESGIRRFVANATGTLAESLPTSLEPVVDQLVAGSGGNAFFLAELWQQLLDTERVHRDGDRWSVGPLRDGDTPRSVREMVDRRLARLGPSARRLVELAACLGETFDVALIAAAAGTPIDDALDAVAEAIDSGLLRSLDQARGAFVHALVRQSIEASLAAGARARHHRAVATALREAGRSEPALLARHYLAAVPLEPPATAVRFAREAARRSIETVLFDDAIAVLRSVAAVADDEGDRADLLVDLALAHARSGDSSAAMQCVHDAARSARRQSDQQRLVRAAKAMFEATWRGALPGGPAATLLQEALAGEVDPVTRCELLGALSGAHALDGQEDASQRAGVEAIELAGALEQPRLLLDAILSRLYSTVLPSNIDAQLELSDRGIRIALDEQNEFSELRLTCKAMLRLFVRFDPPRLARLHARVAELAPRHRQPYYLLVHAGNEVAIALSEGRFADAEAAAERYRQWGEVNHQGDGTYGIQMFSIRREQGRLAELRPLLEIAARLRRGDAAWTPGLAAVYAEAGMRTEATALLDRLVSERLASLPDDSLLPGVMSYLADAAFACNHRDAAQLVLERLAPYAGLGVYVPGLACYGAADRYLGRLHSTLGNQRAARCSFESGLALDLSTGWSTWIAHSQLALAAQLTASGSRVDRGRATTLVDEASALATSLGMTALVRRATELAAQLDGSNAARPAGLTNREREVLRLISDGRSNRQIGETLHASQHTIANHVRAILAKTGAANRTEAASWAHRHGNV